MLNTVRTWNAWFSLSSQAALLGFEAQSVMALRFIRFAAGGPLARSETGRMIAEKVQALGEAQTAAAIAVIGGRNSRHVAKKVLGVYKKRVAKTGGALPSSASGAMHKPGNTSELAQIGLISHCYDHGTRRSQSRWPQ